MQINSSINLNQSTPSSALRIPMTGSLTQKNNVSSSEKLFCNSTPYSSISQTLSEHINSVSHGELSLSKDSGFSTAVNSLMQSQHEQASPIFNDNNSSSIRQQYAKSYAPSPATHNKQEEREHSSESRSSQNSTYQFGYKSQTEKNLQMFHQETFKFLLTLNSNLQQFKEADKRRKLRKELNLEDPSLNKSYFSRQNDNISDVQSCMSFQTTKSAAPTIELKKSRALLEKQNTVQTIIASSFCKSQIFNNKKFMRQSKLFCSAAQ